jgi:glycosyltransferase involved in cell wall biosynthesis
MRIAFYAPMKPPTHPRPSGDRQIAIALMQALTFGGHSVALASELRTYDGAGDPATQRRQGNQGAAEAARLIRQWAAPAARPAAWVTYHVYHKAPDLIGPAVARHFALPYLIVEPSIAPKRAGGPWAAHYAAALDGLRQADVLLCSTRYDQPALAGVIGADRLWHLPPFIDAAPFAEARAARPAHRAALAARHGLDPGKLWLLAVGMFRPGDKLESYRRLGEALTMLDAENWQLVVVGDGEAAADVRQALAGVGAARFVGALDPAAMPAVYAACDLCVWPAAGEAFGIALLEAQAAGLPVVAGRVRGVPEIVRDLETGLLAAENDAAGFAAAVRRLLTNDELRRQFGARAAAHVAQHHGLAPAAAILDGALRGHVRPELAMTAPRAVPRAVQ